jgi:predicted dehydrogenase
MRKLNRREFVRTGSAAFTAGAFAAGGGRFFSLEADQGAPELPPSPNDRIQVALIGAGQRGQGDAATALLLPGVRLVAVADCYTGRLLHCREKFGNGIVTTRDYREILARPDVDAVLIATPDHWHKQAAIDAMAAGKDVYLEKPMIHLYNDGPEIIEVARRTQRILQVGSQRVSSVVHKKAKELLKSGAIGQLITINSWMERTPDDPVLAFDSVIPPDASPETIDWERFLGSAPREPFNAEHFFQWRKWKAYGSGVAGDLFVHLFSGVHFVTGSQGPTRAVAMGGIRYWKDGRDQPDVLMGLFEYPEGFDLELRVNFAYGGLENEGLILVGSEGTLQVTGNSVSVLRAQRRSVPTYDINTWADAAQQQFLAEFHKRYPRRFASGGALAQQETYAAPSDYSEHYDHMKNFLDSVRTRRPVVEDPVFGYRAAGAALLANLSYENERIVHWDPHQMKLIPASQQ